MMDFNAPVPAPAPAPTATVPAALPTSVPPAAARLTASDMDAAMAALFGGQAAAAPQPTLVPLNLVADADRVRTQHY